MKILKIDVTCYPNDQVRWHVIGRTVKGTLVNVYSPTIAKALAKKTMSDLLKDLTDREYAEQHTPGDQDNLG